VLVREVTGSEEAVLAEALSDPDSCNSGAVIVQLSGRLATTEVFNACQTVVRLNPGLRSTVLEVSNGYVLRASDARYSDLDFEVLDVECAPGSELRVAREWFRSHAPRRWDLSSHPPIYFRLLRHGIERRSVIFGVHHIGFDGRSKEILRDHFERALQSRVNSISPDHDQVSAAELNWLRGTDPTPPPDTIEAFASSLLRAGLLDVQPLLLPTEPSGAPDARGSCRSTGDETLDQSLAMRIIALARRTNVSIFGVLLAGLVRQLSYYGNESLVVLVTADSRAASRQIGMQVNLVPVLIRIAAKRRGEGSTPFLDAARDAAGQIGTRRSIPMHKLVRALRAQAARDVSMNLGSFGLSYPRIPASVMSRIGHLELAWDYFVPNLERAIRHTLQVKRSNEQLTARLDFVDARDARTATKIFSDWQLSLTELALNQSAT